MEGQDATFLEDKKAICTKRSSEQRGVTFKEGGGISSMLGAMGNNIARGTRLFSSIGPVSTQQPTKNQELKEIGGGQTAGAGNARTIEMATRIRKGTNLSDTRGAGKEVGKDDVAGANKVGVVMEGAGVAATNAKGVGGREAGGEGVTLTVAAPGNKDGRELRHGMEVNVCQLENAEH